MLDDFRQSVRVEGRSDGRKGDGRVLEGKGSRGEAVITTETKPRLALATREAARDKTKGTGGSNSIPRPVE